MTRTAILLQTHVFNGAAARLFRALQRACGPDSSAFVLMHVAPGTPRPSAVDDVPTHFVTTDDIRVAAYGRKSDVGNPDWRIWGGGHTDLIALHFARSHPEFEHVWVVEYDVRYRGDWKALFAYFNAAKADLLATTIRRRANDPDWFWWSTLRGPDGEPPATTGALCSFMPIFRFSRAAATAIDRAYRAGWTGHCETTWPTLVAAAGLVVEDLGGTGEFTAPVNQGRFYSNTSMAPDLNPGSFVFRPARFAAGLRRNTLYHPVKPPMAVLGDKVRLVKERTRALTGRSIGRLLGASPHRTRAG